MSVHTDHGRQLRHRCPATSCCCPTPQIDDGVFDIVALRPEGFFGWVQIWIKIVWENGVLRRSPVGRKIVSMQREVRTLRYLRGTDRSRCDSTAPRSSSSTATSSVRSSRSVREWIRTPCGCAFPA